MYSFMFIVLCDNVQTIAPSCKKVREGTELMFVLICLCVCTIHYSISYFKLLFHHTSLQNTCIIHKDKSYVGSVFLIAVYVLCVAEFWR
jgi:hypothetical protein